MISCLLYFGTTLNYADWITATVATSLLVSVIITPFTNLAITRFENWTTSEKDAVYKGIFRLMISLGVIPLILIIPLRESIAILIFPQELNYNVIFALYAFLISELIFEILIAFSRASHEFYLASKIMIIRTLIKFLVIITLCYFSIYETINALAGIATIQIIIGNIFLSKKNRLAKAKNQTGNSLNIFKFIAFTKRNIKVIALFGAINLSYGLNNSIDRFFINYRIGQEDLGNYSIHYSLVSLISILFTSVNFINFPQLSQSNKLSPQKKDVTLVKNLTIFVKISIIIVGFFCVWGELLIEIISNGKLHFESDLILLLSAATIFLGINVIATSALIVENRNKEVVVLLLSGAFLNIIANYFLTHASPKSAAISSLISCLYLALGSLYLLRYLCTPILLSLFDLQSSRFAIYTFILFLFINNLEFAKLSKLQISLVLSIIWLIVLAFEFKSKRNEKEVNYEQYTN